MSLQQKTFVETLKEKLTVGTKVYVTSKGYEETSMYYKISKLEGGVITHVYWENDSADFTVKFSSGESCPSEISFERGWLATYDMLTPSDKTILWQMSPEQSHVDSKGEFHKYEQEEIERIRELPDDENLENDMVKSPKHYQLFPEHDLEIKDVNKRILDNIEKSDFDMTLYEASWWTQSSQYMLRFFEKGGVEDLKKCVQTLQFVIDSMEERKQ